MNSIRVDGENILSGTATSLMNMLKTYVCSTNDNTNNPIELRLTGLIPGVDYQLTTYHHSKVGTGASHNGMDLDIILSDGSGGTTTTRAHTGWYWSTSSTANVEDVTRVTTFTAGSDVSTTASVASPIKLHSALPCLEVVVLFVIFFLSMVLLSNSFHLQHRVGRRK